MDEVSFACSSEVGVTSDVVLAASGALALIVVVGVRVGVSFARRSADFDAHVLAVLQAADAADAALADGTLTLDTPMEASA